jgi:hypothetical protein
MSPLADVPELQEMAPRIVWFEPAEQALRDPVRFLAYAFTHATHEAMRVIRWRLGDDALRAALGAAPPGIIDPRSWSCWHAILGQHPPPAMPVRTYADGG